MEAVRSHAAGMPKEIERLQEQLRLAENWLSSPEGQTALAHYLAECGH